jgi:hypothetical protein
MSPKATSVCSRKPTFLQERREKALGILVQSLAFALNEARDAFHRLARSRLLWPQRHLRLSHSLRHGRRMRLQPPQQRCYDAPAEMSDELYERLFGSLGP